jgi:hypothetical protein
MSVMKASRKQQLPLLLGFILAGTIAVHAQAVDCQGTIDAWKADANMRGYAATCSCPVADRMPVCRANGGGGNPGSQPAAVSGNAGTGAAIVNNSGADDVARAEAERKRREEEFKRQQVKLKGSLRTGASGNSTLGLKPSSNIIREQTIKRLKELNCSAFWGIQALNEALEIRNQVTPNLEDEYTRTRQYAGFSAAAKGGKSVQGCPEVKISVPDVPPPLASNPQIVLYDQLIEQEQELLTNIIDTNRTMRITAKWITEAEQETKSKVQELVRMSHKPNTPKNRAEKKKGEAELTELMELALQAQREANELKQTADEQRNKVAELQTKLDVVSKDPDQAKNFLNK